LRTSNLKKPNLWQTGQNIKFGKGETQKLVSEGTKDRQQKSLKAAGAPALTRKGEEETLTKKRCNGPIFKKPTVTEKPLTSEKLGIPNMNKVAEHGDSAKGCKKKRIARKNRCASRGEDKKFKPAIHAPENHPGL